MLLLCNSGFATAPQTTYARVELNDGMELLTLLTTTKLCASRGQARRDIAGGGIYVNDQRVVVGQTHVTAEHLLANSYIVLRRGRKNHHLLCFKEG